MIQNKNDTKQNCKNIEFLFSLIFGGSPNSVNFRFFSENNQIFLNFIGVVILNISRERFFFNKNLEYFHIVVTSTFKTLLYFWIFGKSVQKFNSKVGFLFLEQ